MPSSGYCVALAATQDSHGPEGLARVIDLIESGLYYYDATVVVDNLADAIELGRLNGQIAIFCLDTMEEIRL